ncbi:MAG: insulinase family protein [Myxococcales bacterium]|nr:insulinase family protein [Myxococcales bacterium]
MKHGLTPSAPIAAAILWAIGCAPAPIPPAKVPDPSFNRHGALRVAVVPEPSPGWMDLSLWIDAGSADGSPPQTALLAARLAATDANLSRAATVYPQGTAFHLRCRTAQAPHCTETLLRILSTRHTSAPELASAKGQLERDRQRSNADGLRTVEEGAIRTLLGDESAEALFPFGIAEDDASVTAETIETFWADHYGPSRALLEIRGDASWSLVDGALKAVRSSLPEARRHRLERRIPEGDGVRTATPEGDGKWAAVALRTTDGSHAQRAVRALRPLLPKRSVVRAATVHGAGVVLVVHGSYPSPARLQRTAWRLSVAYEETRAITGNGSSESNQGMDWISRGPGATGAPAIAVCAPLPKRWTRTA